VNPALFVCANHWGSGMAPTFEFGVDGVMVVMGPSDRRTWKSVGKAPGPIEH
jgi:hypothetical protein